MVTSRITQQRHRIWQKCNSN